jgi:hypothetical protein
VLTAAVGFAVVHSSKNGTISAAEKIGSEQRFAVQKNAAARLVGR